MGNSDYRSLTVAYATSALPQSVSHLTAMFTCMKSVSNPGLELCIANIDDSSFGMWKMPSKRTRISKLYSVT